MFLDSKGDVKVGDFGLAVERPEGPIKKGVAVGSSIKEDLKEVIKKDIFSLDNVEGNLPSESDDLTGGVGTTLYRGKTCIFHQ